MRITRDMGELNEALPKDLAKAYRLATSYVVNDENGYANIDDKHKSPLIDFEKSEYKEISKEEAKTKKLSDLRIIFDGQIVTYDENDRPVYVATTGSNTDPKYDYENSTDELTPNFVIDHADKIYTANEVKLEPKDHTSVYSKYGSNYRTFGTDSEIRLGDTSRLYDDHDERDYDKRGEYGYLSSFISKKDINKLHSRIERNKAELAKLQADPDANEAAIRRLTINIRNNEGHLERYLRLQDEQRGDYKDFAAARRNYVANKYLQEPINKFYELKDRMSDVEADIDSALNMLERVKGNTRANRYFVNQEQIKNHLNEIKRNLDWIQQAKESGQTDTVEKLSIANKRLQLIIDELTEWTPVLADLDVKEAEEVNDNIVKLNADKDFIQQQIDDLKSKPLKESLDNYFLDEDAQAVYDRITELGKEDELKYLIDSLYGENLTDDQISDILLNNTDFLKQELGLEDA